MRIYLLVALAQYEEDVIKAFGCRILALNVRPVREERNFGAAGIYEAYYIRAGHILNAQVQATAFWTPVSQYWTMDFDVPAPYPVVMWEGVEPERPTVRPQSDAMDGQTDFDWTPPRKEVLRVMVKYAEKSLEMSLGELATEAGVGKSTASAVKKEVENDHRLLNGLGQQILDTQP